MHKNKKWNKILIKKHWNSNDVKMMCVEKLCTKKKSVIKAFMNDFVKLWRIKSTYVVELFSPMLLQYRIKVT